MPLICPPYVMYQLLHFFFCCWIIFHVHVPHFGDPFISLVTFGLFTLWGYCHNAAVSSCVQVFCRCVFSSLRYISRRGIAESHDNSLQPSQELSECFPRQLPRFTFPPAEYEGSSCSTSLPTFVIVHLFYYSHSSGSEVVSCFGLQVHF